MPTSGEISNQKKVAVIPMAAASHPGVFTKLLTRSGEMILELVAWSLSNMHEKFQCLEERSWQGKKVYALCIEKDGNFFRYSISLIHNLLPSTKTSNLFAQSSMSKIRWSSYLSLLR